MKQYLRYLKNIKRLIIAIGTVKDWRYIID